MRKLKNHNDQYRNINGKRFEVYTTNPDNFEQAKNECKLEGISFRIIEQQFYKEVKK